MSIPSSTDRQRRVGWPDHWDDRHTGRFNGSVQACYCGKVIGWVELFLSMSIQYRGLSCPYKVQLYISRALRGGTLNHCPAQQAHSPAPTVKSAVKGTPLTAAVIAARHNACGCTSDGTIALSGSCSASSPVQLRRFAELLRYVGDPEQRRGCGLGVSRRKRAIHTYFVCFRGSGESYTQRVVARPSLIFALV